MARAARVAAKAQKVTNLIAKVEQSMIRQKLGAAAFSARPAAARRQRCPAQLTVCCGSGSDAAGPGRIFRRRIARPVAATMAARV